MRRKPGQEKPRNRSRVPVQARPNISSGQGIAVMTNADGGRALAESETQFFAAQGFSITLHKDAEQIVTKLTLHAGQVYEATKIL
jgi:hypothetical protein